MKYYWLIVYYGLAKHLPKSTAPILGKMAKWLRRQCTQHLFAECRGKVNVEQGAYFGNGSDIRVLGGKVGFGKNFVCHSRVVTCHGDLLMGEDVLFQGNNHDLTKTKTYDKTGEVEYFPQNDNKDPLDIGEHVWIGARAIILGGCKKIGTGAVIGAGSVVTHDVPENVIIAGNPARIIRNNVVDGQ